MSRGGPVLRRAHLSRGGPVCPKPGLKVGRLSISSEDALHRLFFYQVLQRGVITARERRGGSVLPDLQGYLAPPQKWPPHLDLPMSLGIGPR